MFQTTNQLGTISRAHGADTKRPHVSGPAVPWCLTAIRMHQEMPPGFTQIG